VTVNFKVISLGLVSTAEGLLQAGLNASRGDLNPTRA
jgi:hypothetical protein